MPRPYCNSSFLSSSFYDSSYTQFTRRGGCFCVFCCFCALLHTLPKWPMTPHLLQCFPFAGHTFKCSIEKFSFPHRRQLFFLVIVHIGSLFIVILFSPHNFWRKMPSSYALAKSSASFGFIFGSVHSFS